MKQRTKQVLREDQIDASDKSEDIEISELINETKYFFIVAFVISWTIWIIAPIIASGDMIIIVGLVYIGAFGPSLAAILLTYRKNEEKSNIPKKKQLLTFLIVFIVFLTIGLITNMQMIQIYPFIIVISAIGAYVFSRMHSSNKNTADHFKSLKGVKGNNKYLLIAFFLPLGFYIFAHIISLLFGGQYPQGFTWYEYLLNFFMTNVLLFFLGGPLNEEPGWRGFALPRLQKKMSPFHSGIILGIFWALWHAPLHFNGFYGVNDIGGLFGRFVAYIFIGPLYVWYYNSSKGNVLGCVIFHGSFNAFVNLYLIVATPDLIAYIIINFTLYTIVIILINKYKMGEKPN